MVENVNKELTYVSTVLTQIVMENRAFVEFVDHVVGRDELPVWKDVAECVAALAAFHHLNHLKVCVVKKRLRPPECLISARLASYLI